MSDLTKLTAEELGAEISHRLKRLEKCEAALRTAIPLLESAAEPDYCYGFFVGGDPRNFEPDEESNTPEELEAHRKACEAFTADKPLPGCCEHIFDGEGKLIMTLTKAPFGMGINTYIDKATVAALDMARTALEEK